MECRGGKGSWCLGGSFLVLASGSSEEHKVSLCRKVFLFLILFHLFGAKTVIADTVSSPSCSRTDVQFAINSASTGDIVKVPAGTCEWTSKLVIDKAIILNGAGRGLSIIIDGEQARGEGLLKIISPARITGFTFKGKIGSTQDTRIIDVTGVFSDFRIDNCSFEDGYNAPTGNWSTSTAIYISQAYGLIDNCIFEDAAHEVIQVAGRSNSWMTGSTLGTRNAVYVEDCTFSFSLPSGDTGAAHAIMAGAGGRYVFRYNNLTHYNIDSHGYCGEALGGTRQYEIYDNVSSVDSGVTQARWMYIRGGTGVIFDNIMVTTGTLNDQINLTEHRIDRESCLGGCCCSYPCKDQIGRGTDQTSDPLYLWNNKVDDNDAVIEVTDYLNPSSCEDAGQCNQIQDALDFIQSGRDYILGQKIGYTAFDYPHPLTEDVPRPPYDLNVVPAQI